MGRMAKIGSVREEHSTWSAEGRWRKLREAAKHDRLDLAEAIVERTLWDRRQEIWNGVCWEISSWSDGTFSRRRC